MNLFEKKTLFAILAGFFLLETLLSFWTGLPFDMDIWFNTGKWMTQGINIYLPANHVGYPPLWSLWCDLAYRIFLLFGSLEVWRFAIKLPMIIAHLALAFVVGKLAIDKFDLKTARKLFLFVLSWGFFIYIGALWGQINVISALLTFLAFYAIIQGKTTTSAVLLGVAVTLKVYPLIVLPAFLAYTLRNQDWRAAIKYVLFACAVPILFTACVFAVFKWDILFFLQTIFYWTPFFEARVPQIQGGAMNIWSFFSLFNVDVATIWVLRVIWVPVLLIGYIYWVRKPRLGETDLNLSIISFYVFFMISYGWVTEQTFLDPLPFIFLFILAFEPKRVYLYVVGIIQVFIYIFSVANQSLFIFTPLLERFSPSLLAGLTDFHLENGPLVHAIRGTMGLVISVFLLVLLGLLLKPTILDKAKERLRSIKFGRSKQ